MIATREPSGEAGAPRALAFRLLSDERLAKLAENGSDPAFAAIYGRYATILHGYCRSIVRDDDEARDALQNAMLKALAALRRQGRSGPLRPWLFRIAHNESISLLRTRARRPDALDDRHEPSGAPDAHRHAEAREHLSELLDDLGSLTDHQRGALVMRELGGLGYDEIATALETSPLAARQAVFTARRNLVAMGEARGRPPPGRLPLPSLPPCQRARPCSGPCSPRPEGRQAARRPAVRSSPRPLPPWRPSRSRSGRSRWRAIVRLRRLRKSASRRRPQRRLSPR